MAVSTRLAASLARRERMKAIRDSLLWRHRILWSYRFDIFCSVLIASLITVSAFDATLIYSHWASRSKIAEMVTSFDKQYNDFLQIIADSTTSDIGLSSDKLRSLDIVKPAEVSESAFNNKADEIRKQIVSIGFNVFLDYRFDKSLGNQDELVAKIASLLSERYFVDAYIINSHIYMGWFFESLLLIIVALLPVCLLAYYILMVFYTDRLYIINAHPNFSIVLTQFICIILLSILLTICVENLFEQTYSIIKESNAFVRPESRRHHGFETTMYSISINVVDIQYLPNRIIESLVTPYDKKIFYLSRWFTLLLSTLCFISMFISATRLFNFTTAVASSAIAIAMAVGIIAILSQVDVNFFYFTNETDLLRRYRDVMTDTYLFRIYIIWIFSTFCLIFLIGIFYQKIRSICLSTGFTGVVVTTAALITTIVPVYTASLIWVFLVSILACGGACLTESIMRRAIYRYLFEPQP
jgi:hypothetical protein